MFERFQANYKLTAKSGDSAFISRDVLLRESVLSDYVDAVTTLFGLYSGGTFNDGMYRLHNVADIEKWTEIVVKCFPKYRGQLLCFGYDWLGRHFALNVATKASENIFMFEPGTGEVLDIPTNFIDFHDQEIVDYPNEVFAAEFFKQWSQAYQLELNHQDCVGYKIPLFLSGEDTINNLEMINMDVYWTICGQLINQARTLPPGTTIGSVKISE